MDDPRHQFPVLTASGFFVQPSPSPLRRKRPPTVREAASGVASTVGSKVVTTRALDDHIAFSEVLTTKEGSDASVMPFVAASSVAPQRESLATQRAICAQRGSFLGAAEASAESLTALFPSSSAVVGYGKRHLVTELTGVGMRALLNPPGASSAPSTAAAADFVGAAAPLRPRMEPSANSSSALWEQKVMPVEPRRRYLRGAPPEVVSSASNPLKETSIY